MTGLSVGRDSIAVALGVALAVGACAPTVPATSPLQPSATQPSATRPTAADPPVEPTGPAGPVAPAALAGWSGDDLAGVDEALDAQCAAARASAPWVNTCAAFRENRGRLRAWLEREFVARPLTDAAGAAGGLVTGYHEPELRGSLARNGPDQVPLYRRPPEAWLRERPTRAEIEGSPRFASQVLAWLDDPVEAFFLHVQGSGRIRLREGATMRVGYAGDNGHPYRAIGATLVARGALTAEGTNAGTIKAWLRANPAQAVAVMQSNPRYIFFREIAGLPEAAGPLGALGVPLTPLRSIAVDPARIPAGALAWLDTTNPLDGRPLRRLVLAQDTGAAIVGPVRADLFWGTGPQAERAAGLMKQRGRLWVLEARRATR